MKTEANNISKKLRIMVFALTAITFFIYYFSNPIPQNYYDYTFRVAENMIRGDIGFGEKPPSWLNEFVPFEGEWYSVFPLGSVVTMMPFAFFKAVGRINEMPAALISALTAGAICLFLLMIALNYDELELKKKILFVFVILFGTWMWTNETVAGAWQLALGWAVLGELGAIYFSAYNRKPFLAGLFFALAFGNRTEILLTAPIFMVLLFCSPKSKIRSSKFEDEKIASAKNKAVKKEMENPALKSDKNSFLQSLKSEISKIKSQITNDPKSATQILAAFCFVPFVLGVLTLVYNYVRFRSFTDFGYARIPGVLNEPWYGHGIFSVYYIPRQAYEMLLKPWETLAGFPYLAPDAFSSSILWSSPFLLLLFRFGKGDKVLCLLSWTAIIILTILLWMHGNSGGWQFGYRYAMVLLPWIFLILLENSPKKITFFEAATCILSFIINIYAVYLFHWTEFMKR